MNILVINCGSSSIKAAIIDTQSGNRLFRLKAERIGTKDCQLLFGDADPEPLGDLDIYAAIQSVFEKINNTCLLYTSDAADE